MGHRPRVRALGRQHLDNMTLQEKAKTFIQKENEELSKLGLVARPTINFPKRKKIPFLSRISLWILDKQGAIIDTQFFSRDNK